MVARARISFSWCGISRVRSGVALVQPTRALALAFWASPKKTPTRAAWLVPRHRGTLRCRKCQRWLENIKKKTSSSSSIDVVVRKSDQLQAIGGARSVRTSVPGLILRRRLSFGMRCLVVLLFLFCASAAVAGPCIPPSDLVPQIAFPSDGAIVPTNGSILLHDTEAILELVGAVSGPLGFQTELLEVDDGFGPVFYRRVVPALGLPAGDTVQFRIDGVLVLSFVVDTLPDDEAPPAPSVFFEGPYSDGACVPYASIGAASDASDVAVFIGARGAAPTFRDGTQLSGLSASTTSLVVSGPDAGSATIRVAAVDVAGNVSGDVEIAVEFPDTRNGCPCAPVAPGLLLPVLLARRSRR